VVMHGDLSQFLPLVLFLAASDYGHNVR
jgi:hypothetical protein